MAQILPFLPIYDNLTSDVLREIYEERRSLLPANRGCCTSRENQKRGKKCVYSVHVIIPPDAKIPCSSDFYKTCSLKNFAP